MTYGLIVAIMLTTVPLPFLYGKEALHAAERKDSTIASDTTSSPVECSGQILPLRRHVIRIGTEERLGAIFVKDGAWVEKDAPLVKLENNVLPDHIIRLMTDSIALQEALLHIENLRIKVQMLQEEIMWIDERIKEEKEFKEALPNYPVEGILKKIEEEKKRKEWELRLISNEMETATLLSEMRQELLQRLKDRINILQEREKSLVVKAPFSGRVVMNNPSPETIRPGEVLLELWDESTLVVKAEVWQNQIRFVKPGETVEIFPNFSRTFSVPGTVRSIGRPTDYAQSEKGFPVFPVTIDLQGRSKKLLPGMAVTVRFGGASKER